MIKKVALLLLIAVPTSNYSLHIANWKTFYCGSAALSLSALCVFLNIREAKHKASLKEQNIAQQNNIKQALADLGVHFRDYYGYQRSGNAVNTETIIHSTSIDMPQNISEEQRTLANSYYCTLLDLQNESTSHNDSYTSIAGFSALWGVLLLGGSFSN